MFFFGPKVHTLLFVCHGNLCRSFMAERIARRDLATPELEAAAKALGIKVDVLSAGTHAVPGTPPPDNAVAALEELGIEIVPPHDPRPIDLVLYRRSRLIFLMDRYNAQWVYGGLGQERLYLLKGFPQPFGALANIVDTNIEDPYLKDLDAYRATRDEIAGLLARNWPLILDALANGKPSRPPRKVGPGA